MTPTFLAFIIGVFVGVLGEIFIIGLLQMVKEERRIAAINKYIEHKGE